MGEPEKNLTLEEIAQKLPSVIALVLSIQKAVKEAEIDGRLTGEELGGILALAAPQLGRLVDEIIADAND